MSDALSDRLFWEPHSNPGTVWVLPVAYLSLLLALYRRDRSLGAATLLFVAAHPLVFPAPDDDSAWGTRVVRGERRWLADGLRSSPLDALLIAVGAPLNLFTLRAAVRRQPVRLAVGAVLSVVFMFVFFARMARHYDRTTAS
jgi:hypothetical protein